MSKKLFTLTGPSCSGKTTLIRKLLQSGHFAEVVSFTSRQPRSGEVHGTDYYFLDSKTCEKLVAAGETAEAINFKGNWYGITKAEIQLKFSEGKTPIVIVEPNGLKQLRETFSLYTTYVDAKLETLYTRYLSRFKQYENPNIEYEAKRIAGLYLEHKEWPAKVGDVDFYINEYRPDNEAEIQAKLIAESIYYNETESND